METDALAQVENTHRIIKKSQLPAQIACLFIFIVQLVINLQRVFEEPAIQLANNLSLATILLFNVACFIGIAQISGYFLWYCLNHRCYLSYRYRLYCRCYPALQFQQA